MRPNILFDQLRSGKVSLGLALMYKDAGLIEGMYRQGWDWIWIDGQHGQLSYDSCLAAVRAAEAVGLETVVRAPGQEYGVIGPMLDLAPSAIMIPMVNNAEEAKKVVDATRFPPLGNRSYGGRRVVDIDGTYYYKEREMIVIAQIETVEAVKNAEEIINTDGINFVDPFGENRQALSDLNTFVYCDPPYLIHTRLSRKIIYKHEMTIHQHTRLLRNLLNIDCMVAISGYPAPLYAHHLASWRSFEYQQVTRSGKTVTEVLWMNYPEPTHLHDYNFLGRNYRERERIKKKIARWTAKLKSLPSLEREAIMESLKTI